MISLLFSTMLFSAKAAPIPHLDLDLSGAELAKIYESTHPLVLIEDQKRRLDEPIRAGKRNLDWLQYINNSRIEKISFTNPATQRGIPMDKPSEYNEAIAYKKYTEVVAQMPASMKKVIVDGAAFTKDPGVSVDDYILWGDKMDRAYQTAIRWTMMEPYLSQLAGRRYMDVRGFYFIDQTPNRDQTLDSLHTLPALEQEKFAGWLTGVCINSRRDEKLCAQEARNSIQNRDAKSFFKRYRPDSQQIWDSFYSIPSTYSGLEWSTSQPDLAVVPFVTQNTTEMSNFLKVNLEDEWKWNSWKLKIDFNPNANYPVEVIWQPGITPHVPGLGSNQIYMDSNAPLTEWDVQWTIRHEFGHVLGFPDCYLEFYDSTKGVIINYQFDVADLMCSRSGKLKERHFTEMKRVYLR